MHPPFVLVSHHLCPYVQRVAIVLSEKQASFERRYVDLANKPEWFLDVSPLGKTPVLLVDQEPIFESAAICEYLDETIAPRMHPEPALLRAQHRAWVEFSSTILSLIGRFYDDADAKLIEETRTTLAAKFAIVEAALGNGPYFAGAHFSIVDAAFGPIFRYFDVFDQISDFGICDATPKVRAWRSALARRPSVRDAVQKDYNERLQEFLLARKSELSARMAAA